MVFDCAVNQGVGRAKKWLQRAVGAFEDGHVGPKTLEAVKAVPVKEAILTFAEIREAHYRSLSTFKIFGKGWMRRLKEVTADSLKWTL